MSIRWNHVYYPDLFSNVSFIYSNYKYSTAYSSTSDNNTLNYSWNSGIEQISLKAEYNYYLNNYNTIDFGASTTYKHFMPGQLEGNITAIDNITNAHDLPPVYVPVRSLVFLFRHWQAEGDRMSPVPVACNPMNCVV